MRAQSIMKIKGAAAVQEVGGAAAGRGLNEGERQGGGVRAGRSEIAYMQQHKYTPLDVRIIIITAAILLLLLSVLFLNFFIRWALRRFFLLPSQKPINPNKGLSKRQVQALPSFIYSSSKPPFFASSHATPWDHPKFYHDLMPITFHGNNNFGHHLNAHSCHDLHPTKIGSTKVDEFYNISPPTKSKVVEVDQKTPSPLGSTKFDEVDNDPPTKFGSLEVDEVIEGNNPILGSTKGSIDCEVKANSPTFKGADEMSNHGDDNASSPAPCPICLVDYTDGETIRVLPTCRHYFHIGCIDMWLAKNSSCPACRANILEATRTPIKQPTLQVQVIITSSH